ncbi:MAG: restriction endonuclease subunit S [Hydrogenophaga sp.]|uniref:restriction endonuclease subunit S n=1 Tax=Hydrogenophaga sp. TaxID=1904254 RepID=UPI002ABADF10|nr:restriction endonuclease subunit S [Hydrogenophaga sp.]MDZ4188789.1 restriction endonuclease subunit S [Hydrogenophaga sp.]
MGSEWQVVTVGELAASTKGALAVGPFGSRMKADLYTPNGVRVIRGNNLGLGVELKGDFVHVAPETADSLASCCLQPGDLVFPHRGNIGEVGVTPNDSHRYMLSTSLMKLSPDTALVDPFYLFYFFKSTAGRAALLVNASQVGTPGIATPLKSLRGIELKLPPLPIQKEITDLLRSLDDRITLLRETNATLEAIAQALFKSWFVDFDPVRAKMEGRAPEGMDETTAALFPDSLEDTALGVVPKGWLPRTFRETIDIIGGGTPKTSNPDFWNGTIPWFSVVDAPAASDVFVIDTEKYITVAGLNGSSTKLLPAGTTIISARGTVGRLALTGCPMTMNQSCYGLRGKAGDDYFTFFSTTRLVQQLQQKAHGSVFDTITQETFAGVYLSYPSAQVIAAFDSAVDALMLRIRENLIHSQTLSTLRDTLLPRLISGQLRVPEAQAQPEGTTT